jgi:AraC-binding-like domain
MRVVFDTKTLAAAQRRGAWREAICEIYLQVDCMADRQDDYSGFVREARLGAVTLTDTLCSPQWIHRQAHHTAHFGKDCYYFGIEHLGEIDIRQAGSSFLLRPGNGSLYYANEPYSLRSRVKSRQFWVELPREAFDRRFSLPSASREVWDASPPSSAPPSLRRAPTSMRPPASSSASSSWTFWRWRCTANPADNRRRKRAYNSRVWARSRPTSNRIWATRIYRWRR